MRHAPAFLALVFLSGCFVSEKPLVTAANADYPFAASLTFERRNDGGKDSDKGTLTRMGDHYHMVETDDVSDLMFHKVRDGLFIGQYAPQKPGEKYFYDAVTFDGKTASTYAFTCDPKKDEASFAVTHPSGEGDICTVADLGTLARVFRARLGAGAKPQAHYTITKGN